MPLLAFEWHLLQKCASSWSRHSSTLGCISGQVKKLHQRKCHTWESSSPFTAGKVKLLLAAAQDGCSCCLARICSTRGILLNTAQKNCSQPARGNFWRCCRCGLLPNSPSLCTQQGMQPWCLQDGHACHTSLDGGIPGPPPHSLVVLQSVETIKGKLAGISPRLTHLQP